MVHLLEYSEGGQLVRCFLYPRYAHMVHVNWVLGSQELWLQCPCGHVECVLQEFLSSNMWQCMYRVFECSKHERTAEVVGNASREDDEHGDGNGQAIYRTET